MTLQQRTKWNVKRRNVRKGDVVILKDPQPRNCWQLGRIVEAIEGEDGLVRHVKVQKGDRSLDKQGRRINPVTILERPIQKIVVLLEAD